VDGLGWRGIERGGVSSGVRFRFAGGMAVVTGAGSGIGRGLALALAREGMRVVVVGRDEGSLAETVGLVAEVGGSAWSVVCDVSDREQVFELSDRVRSDGGGIDVLALNAGVTTAGPLVGHSPADWDWVFGTVLMGVVYGIEAFLGGMLSRGSGQILITGSQVGITPDVVLYHGPYTSAKAAVSGLAVALRPEAAERGVGVSLLVPAGVHTGLMDSAERRPSVLSGEIASEDVPHPSGAIFPRPGGPELAPGGGEWLDPDRVAEIAVEGIRLDKPFIVTHPGMKPVVEEYTSRLLKAYDDGAPGSVG